MNKFTTTVLLVLIALLVGFFVITSLTKDPNQNNTVNNSTMDDNTETENVTDLENPKEQSNNTESIIVAPINRAGERITKKLYGTYVTPKNSPVSPESFTGFHTGLDFEVFESEANVDVEINAICNGELLRKTTATGYGGYAVQSCDIDGIVVTVVYGHLRLSSITAKIGEQLTAGKKLAVLGTGYSTETSNERKHLHLSIHTGTDINIKGYVQSKPELNAWMDPKVVLGL